MYTKGNWYHLIDTENRHHVMSEGKSGDMEQNVAVMSVRPEAKANAQLLASAPDLYEALKFMAERYKTVEPLYSGDRQAIEKADKALAKAEGENEH